MPSQPPKKKILADTFENCGKSSQKHFIKKPISLNLMIVYIILPIYMFTLYMN